MAFALAFRTEKRLRHIDGDGTEEFETPDALDMSYLQLLDPKRSEPDTEQEAVKKDEEEPALNPMEAYEKFTTAKGELDVVIDLITNLEGARYLDFRLLSKARRDNPFQELADESSARFARHRCSLHDVSQRLRQGAAALRAAAQRDNRFYNQVAQLQRFWKLRLNPMVAEFADSPCSVDMTLAEGGGQQGEGGAEESKAAFSRLGTSPLVPLVKHSSGEVSMRLDREQEQATALWAAAGGKDPSTGLQAVHRRLLDLQQQLMWRTVSVCLEDEARAVAAASNFSYSLASRVLEAVAAPGASRQMAALRALLLEHISTCKLQPTSTDPPRPYTPAVSSIALLPELVAWISHCFYRDHVQVQVEEQAHEVKRVLLHWVPTTQSCTSALQICLAPNHRLLLLLTEKSVEVEGIAPPQGSRSRWAREGAVGITKLEVPNMLLALVQQALGAKA